MTPEALKSHTRKDLATMARRRGVDGWHSMRKDELVKALLDAAGKSRTGTRRPAKPKPASRRRSAHATAAESPPPRRRTATNGSSNGSTAARKATTPARPLRKDLGAQNGSNGHPPKERFVVLVRDPFWLQAYWELNRTTICRAEAALGAEWHRAVPMIRVLDVSGDDHTSAVETWIRDIEVHGGVNHWYIPIDGQPRTYRLQIGYRVPSGRFFVLARSNVVTPPRPGSPGAFDGHWSDVEQQCERVFSLSGGYADTTVNSPLRELFEERLRRPMGGSAAVPFNAGLRPDQPSVSLDLRLNAEVILYGSTSRDAHVTIQGDPIQLREDGSFVLRMSLTEGRQVIPAVAVSADGNEQRTVILAIERNTKELEPQTFEDA